MRRKLPATPSQGAEAARRFLDELANETPVKSRRQVIASRLVVAEREREKIRNRIKKHKQRMRDLVARLEADESEKAKLDSEIVSLKRETMKLESQ